MTVPFLEARFDECRTPRWTDATPLKDKMVCGAPTLPGKSYCAACRAVLIAGVVDKNGEARWFNPTAGARWRKKPEDTTDDAESLFHSPDLGDEEVTSFKVQNPTLEIVEEAEPEGDRPFQPADLFDWGLAA